LEALKVCELLNKYGKCPKCGNEYLGNGNGTLEVEDETFKRTCKCGFKIITDEDGNEL